MLTNAYLNKVQHLNYTIKSIAKNYVYRHKVLNVSISVTNLHKSLDIGMVTVLQLSSRAINSIIGSHALIYACAVG